MIPQALRSEPLTGWCRVSTRRQPLFLIQAQFHHPVRPLHLKIAACAILSVGALIAIRQNATLSPAPDQAVAHSVIDGGKSREFADGKHAGLSRTHTEFPSTHAGQKRRSASLDTKVYANIAASIAARESVAAEKYRGALPDDGSGCNHEPKNDWSQTRQRAVRLAAAVRLPAAIMAQGDPEPTLHRNSKATMAANQAISDSFYGDLLSDTNNAHQQDGNDPDAGPEDDEIVIPPGLEVRRATHRADEAYRTMFGDAAYNRQSMMSALEVLLPEESADSGN